jgi:hypothetical protein
MLFGHARLPRLNDVKLLRPAGVQRLFEGDPVSAEDPVDRSLGRGRRSGGSQPRSSQPGAVVVRGHKFQKANKHRYSSWMSSIGELQLSANIWTAPRLEHETKPPQISSESG